MLRATLAALPAWLSAPRAVASAVIAAKPNATRRRPSSCTRRRSDNSSPMSTASSTAAICSSAAVRPASLSPVEEATDAVEVVHSWQRTTCEQGLFYRDHRDELIDKYAGQYVLLQQGEVRWSDPVSDLKRSRRKLSGDAPDQAMYLKYVDPEEAEVEVRGVFEILSTLHADSIGGQGDLGDGGLEIWAAPGIQIYLSRDILIEAAVQLPIFQDIQDSLGR